MTPAAREASVAHSLGLLIRSVVGGSRGWRAVCLRTGGGSPCESNASWHDWSPGTQGARFPGGDRALATTSGRHHGQAIRIDSFEVDDCGRPCDRPPCRAPPSGASRGSGAGGSSLVLVLCPRRALTAGGCTGFAPLRCLSARYTRPRENARFPLRLSPPTAPPLAVRSDTSQAIRNCLAGHA
jgi:hypothetical protein